MDYAVYLGERLTIAQFMIQNIHLGEQKALDKLRRYGDKKALTCPFCQEQLIVRAGSQREIHFSHKGKSCLISSAYDTYLQQTQRESKKHSAIRSIIYDELKNQEKYKTDIKVDYGYVAKAEEKWKIVPDICLKTANREIAINIITNVHEIGDQATVKQFTKRDHFFREKGMDVAWFVEDRELADDMDHRVIHLWEAEYNLASKTDQDEVWDALLYELDNEEPLRVYEVMGYQARKNLDIDVRSLYYVHSINDQILFSVYRIILDEQSSPYRSFAVNRGYQMSLSSALIVSENIRLSYPEQDELDRVAFKDEYEKRKQEINKFIYPEPDPVIVTPSESSPPLSDDPYEYESNVDPVVLAKKLRSYSINEEEAYQFYGYVRKHRSSLEDYGLTFAAVKYLAKQALGAISNPKIRIWLVEIMEL